MDHFEFCPSRTVYSSYPPHILCLSLEAGILDNDVADLEKSQRERVLTILAYRLQNTRVKRRSYNLILDRFGICQDNGERSRIWSVQECKVLIVGALYCNDPSMSA